MVLLSLSAEEAEEVSRNLAEILEIDQALSGGGHPPGFTITTPRVKARQLLGNGDMHCFPLRYYEEIAIGRVALGTLRKFRCRRLVELGIEPPDPLDPLKWLENFLPDLWYRLRALGVLTKEDEGELHRRLRESEKA